MAATATAEPARSAPTPAQSLREYGRGIAGGLLFSLPVLYTMEMWWTGFMATPERLLAGLAVTLGMLLLYNRYAGLRGSASWKEVAIDSVEELGIGLVLSLMILWLIGQFDSSASWSEITGKVIVEGMAAAIGVSVGTAQLGAAETQHGETAQGMQQDGEVAAHEGQPDQGMSGDGSDAAATLGGTLALGLCGAFLVASNIAPTDEIVRIAAETAPGHLAGLALLSLVLTGLVLYFSNFRGTQRADAPHSLDVLINLTSTYAVAVVTAIFLLWFFDRFAGASLFFACAQIAVLGFPAALGASAGRLLLQGASS